MKLKAARIYAICRVGFIATFSLSVISFSRAFATSALFAKHRPVARVAFCDIIPSWSSCPRRMSKREEEDGKEDPSPPDIEAARRRLESLVGSSIEETTNKNSEKDSSNTFSLDDLLSTKREFRLPPAPPMTSMDRDRRLAEIEVLKRLADGDEGTRDLWNLWFSERGPKSQFHLKQADELLSNPSTWEQCETLLLGLIQEHGVYFVEPVNRLATLYYLQGRYDQSFKLCKVILEIKPWHFGALSGIVAVCIAKGDREEARFWANRRLPTYVSLTSFPPFAEEGPENPRRKEWVDRAVAEAEQKLADAEQRTKKSFGRPETYYKEKKNTIQQQETDNYLNMNDDDDYFDSESDDAWQ